MNLRFARNQDEHKPLFADGPTALVLPGDTLQIPPRRAWPVLVVDDDESVHAVTRLSLRGLTVQARPVDLLEARSAAEARAILATRDDIALMLVDVVMETNDAGLKLVHHVRHTLDNHAIRIVLSTGQPGAAPEETVMNELDVNGYLSKSDLDARRLRTAVAGAIRSYQDVATIARQSLLMESVARMQGRFIENQAPLAVAQAMLGDMLQAFDGTAGMLLARYSARTQMHVIATTEPLEGEPLASLLRQRVEDALVDAELSGDLGLRRSPFSTNDLAVPVAFAETWLLPLHSGNRVLGAVWMAVPSQLQTTTDAALLALAHAAASLLKAIEAAALRRTAEEGRATANNWLTNVTANVPDGLLVEEASGQIKLVNMRFCEMFGIEAPPEALVGLDCKLAAAAAAEKFVDAARFVSRVHEIIAKREPVAGEVLEMHDGRWLERDFVPLTVNGELATVWRYHDITVAKRTQEALLASQSRYASLFHAASDAILILDVTGTVVDANESAGGLLEIAHEHLIGMKFRDLFAQTTGGGRALLADLNIGEPVLFEDRLRRPNGAQFPAELHASLVEVEGAQLVEVNLRDITARQRQQDALLAAKTAADAASAAKSQFLAVMSHEIRTPINAILGSSELLRISDLRPSQRELAGIVHDSSEVLLTLINDLLDFSKIEAGQIELESEPFDLASLLESVVDIVRVRALARGLTLCCTIDGRLPTRVVGDVNRFRQIATNLLSNAIKFTEVGDVSLCVRVRERTAESVSLELAVADTGVGIAAEQRDSVFGAFVQGDSSTARRFGGSGLGLSIVRSLVEMMGGRIALDSEPRLGTTMTVSVTLATPADVQTVGAWRGPNRPHGTVLLVMDAQPQRAAIVEVLTDWGLDVVVAANGTETLDKLSGVDSSYRCVIVDDALPDMEGEEVVTAVRSIQCSAHLSVILATALQASETDERNVLKLAKPLHRGRLRLGIAQALGLKISDGLEVVRVVPEQNRPWAGRVLVAEDNPENAILLRHTLTGTGYVVDEVADGEAAVAAVMANQYGLVLMDVEMPALDGISATQRIRDWEKTLGRPRTPIIAVTAHALRAVRERCLAAGMNDYMSKPLRRKRVLEMTDNWLNPKPFVLLADDDQSSRTILRSWLRAEKGLRCLVVGDGQEVLDAFSRYPVALVVLDMQMPGLDGYDTVEQLRRLPGGARVPVIAMTGNIGRGDETRCRKAGCTDFIGKPFTREIVLSAIDKYVTRLDAQLPVPKIWPKSSAVTPMVKPSHASADGAPTMRVAVPLDVADLVPEFLQAQQQTAENIRAALNKSDFAQIALLGHNLRGVSGTMGFNPMARTAGKIERAGLDGHPEAAAQALRELDFLLTAATEDTQF